MSVNPSEGHTGKPPESAHTAPAAASGDELLILLERASSGDQEAFGRAYSALYQELAVLARSQRARWRGNETISTTVLVHEAYLKLAGTGGASGNERWEGRRHFFALAAQVMRQVLVNYAEAQQAAKRGGDAVIEPLDPQSVELAVEPSSDGDSEEILALHAALQRLAERNKRQAQIVECRFFTGLSIPETADVLGLSPATVKRDWQEASAWLYGELGSHHEQ